jgi:uncharacterized protein (TIGR02217 family)
MVDNVIMPEAVSVGFKGGPRFYTDKVRSGEPAETPLPNTTIAEHVYTWSHEDAPAEMVIALRSFFYDRRGDLKPFLMKDWADFRLVGEEIGLGDGEVPPSRSRKTYTAGSTPMCGSSGTSSRERWSSRLMASPRR